MSADWGTIESSPDVFSTLLWQLGVKGLEVEDLWSLDEELLGSLRPIYAFIFLFRWKTGAHDIPESETGETGREDYDFYTSGSGGRYFARQTVQNACGTLALLNATLNLPSSSSSSPGLELGELLSNLKAFSAALDPETAGLTIEGSQEIRLVHNGFARNDPFLLEEARKATDEDEVYHFITYLPIDGSLYELDGLRPVPVNHGSIKEGMEWTEKAREVIERRIATYGGGELRFNLMAIIADQKAKLESQISSTSDQSEIAILHERLEEIELKRKNWDFENALRRHNHIGFIHQLLLGLAKEGKLEERIEKAKAKMQERKKKGEGLDEL
ncbi:hypothetical protein BT69DRAFT_1278540 [Atractiella rhizophila]|nr:hypothetical protein BT69DRAFT_1278540 [Atractiella rhizophila]